MTPTKRPAGWAKQLLYLVLLATIVVYVLRGLAILSWMPGGVIWVLLLLSLTLGALSTLLNLR